MRLFLAVAVLLLAFVAYTEAQEDTVEQRFTKFGEKVTELGRDLAEKVKTNFQKFHSSDTAHSIRNWFNEQTEKVKNTFQN